MNIAELYVILSATTQQLLAVDRSSPSVSASSARQ